MVKILFVCVHNAGRSQIAKAFVNRLSAGKAVADSAGTKPSDRINPIVAQAMKEIGIDISGEKPKILTLELIEQFDRVITMGCGVDEACPANLLPTEDWGIEDPSEKPIEEVRRICDEIKKRVEYLLAHL